MKYLFFVLLILVACTQTEELKANDSTRTTVFVDRKVVEMESVTLTTSDGEELAGNYWSGSEKGVLLLHMMPDTKESWDYFADLLVQKGYTILAFDQRGHGESSGGDYRSFTDEQQQAKRLDVEAGVALLEEKGVTELYIVGASIGANLALQYQAEHPEVKKTILLSAGTNYRGIETIPLASQLREDQFVYLVGGEFDGNSRQMTLDIGNALDEKATVEIKESDQHGTNLFKKYPELAEKLVMWLG